MSFFFFFQFMGIIFVATASMTSKTLQFRLIVKVSQSRQKDGEVRMWQPRKVERAL